MARTFDKRKVPRPVDPDAPYPWPGAIRKRQIELAYRLRIPIKEDMTPRQMSAATQLDLIKLPGVGRLALKYVRFVLGRAGLGFARHGGN